MNYLIVKAVRFAFSAHRQYTGEPYITHPLAVAEMVARITEDVDMICAAILHDTVEDTEATLHDIESNFNPRIRDLVSDLTDVSKPEDGNRAERKALDRRHSALASNDAKTIKLADLIHNSECILAHDKNFARIYMKEKARLLDVLVGGDEELMAKATEIVNDYYST